MSRSASRTVAGGAVPQVVARVHRNFWVLLAATVLASGILSDAVRRPSGPATALMVVVSALAAVTSLSLAGRILVVTTSRRQRAPRAGSTPVRHDRH